MQAQDQAARHRFQAPENLNLMWPWVSIFPLVGPGPGAKGVSSGWCVAEKSYAQLVFMSTSAGSLWNLHAIHSMCRMEQDQVSWLGRCQRLGGNQGHQGPDHKEIQLSQDSQPGLGESIPCLENYCNPAERFWVGRERRVSCFQKSQDTGAGRQTLQEPGDFRKVLKRSLKSC